MKDFCEKKNVITSEGWLEVSHEIQSQIKVNLDREKLSITKTMCAIFEVYNTLKDLIEVQFINNHSHGEALQIDTEIMHFLRVIRIKIFLANLCKNFIILVNFYNYAELNSSIESNFFPELPSDINDNIFGNLKKGIAGYINLDKENETRRNLAMVNINGFRMFNKSRIHELFRLITTYCTYNTDIRKILTNSPELLVERICFKSSYIELINITAFEYALSISHLNNELCFFMIKCLTKTDLGEALRVMLLKQLEKYRDEGAVLFVRRDNGRLLPEALELSTLIIHLEKFLKYHARLNEDYWKKFVKKVRCIIHIDNAIMNNFKFNFLNNFTMPCPALFVLQWSYKPIIKIASEFTSKFPELTYIKEALDFLKILIDFIRNETFKGLYILLHAPLKEPFLESDKKCSVM